MTGYVEEEVIGRTTQLVHGPETDRAVLRRLRELAAAYAFGIVKNHPFNDGNKRAAATTIAVFLKLNGVYFRTEESALVLMMEGVAKNTVEESALASWVEENSHVEKRA